MNTRLSKNYFAYFILDEGKLRRLLEVLLDYARKKDYECDLAFEVERANNSTYNADSVDTVLKDDNVKHKELRRLNIKLQGRSADYIQSTECTIVFESREPNSYSPTVQYAIKDADERWAFSLSEDLDTYIQRALVHQSKGFDWLFLFIKDLLNDVSILLLILLIGLFYPLRQRHVADINLLEAAVFLTIFGILNSLSYRIFSELKPFERLSNLMKVNSVFYWGDQKELYESQRSFRQNIKWVVVIGFMVSAAAGILVAFLLNR